MSQLNFTFAVYLLCLIFCSDLFIHTFCFEWMAWGKPKVTKKEPKGDDYINPWLFETVEKEPEIEPIDIQSNIDYNQPQIPINNFIQQPQVQNNFGQQPQLQNNFGQQPQLQNNFGHQPQQQNNFGQQPQQQNNFGQQFQAQNNFGQQPQTQMNNFGQHSGQMNNQGLTQNGQNNVHQKTQQWAQGHQQALPAANNVAPSANNVNPPAQPANKAPSQVKDFFMEPVNNQKPEPKGMNSWLSGDYEVPEWIKNPAPKTVNEPPRKTKWEMEDEENRKKAQMLQKRGKDVPPAYAHDFRNNYGAMLANKALDSRGNLLYATPQEIMSAKRGSGYLTREEMIREGSFQKVPKNYYEGKIVPMEETKAIISYTDKKLKLIQNIKPKSPNKRTNKDPPKEITGKNWLENLMGNASITKFGLLAILTELTFILVAHVLI